MQWMKQGIQIVGVIDFSMMIDGFEHILRLTGDLGEQKHLFARQALDGAAEPIKGLIGLGAIEKVIPWS